MLIGGNCIPNSSVIVKKHILEKIGYLCEKPAVRTWEDFDAWIRISQITNKFHKVNKTIGYVWLGGGNELMGSKNSQILEQMYQNIIEIEKRYDEDLEKLFKRGDMPWWNMYKKGEVLFLLKKNSHSLKKLQELQFSKIPLSFLLKTIYMIIVIQIFRKIYNAKI